MTSRQQSSCQSFNHWRSVDRIRAYFKAAFTTVQNMKIGQVTNWQCNNCTFYTTRSDFTTTQIVINCTLKYALDRMIRYTSWPPCRSSNTRITWRFEGFSYKRREPTILYNSREPLQQQARISSFSEALCKLFMTA